MAPSHELSQSATASKDTIYIDVDDEITSVIERVDRAKHKVVALVLPKHVTVFQSAVNMKLLKKASLNSSKNLVLITSDKSVIAICAAAGIHVAKTLSTKPEIPMRIKTHSYDEGSAGSTEKLELESEQLSTSPKTTDSDIIELDNSDSALKGKENTNVKEKSSKFKIPDFGNFRVKLGVSVLALVLLIVGWVYAFVIAPKATVTINTDVSTSAVDAKIVAKVGSATFDLEQNIIPAQLVQVEKQDTATVPATGKKNVGQKAIGTMTLTNCINDGEDKIIPAGTTFSSGSFNFVTTEQVTIPFAIYAGKTCKSSEFGRQKDVGVIASQSGSDYNIAARSYTSSISGIQAYGSDMSGGTNDYITVVSAEDVDNAKKQLSGVSKTAALEDMKKQLTELGLKSIDETITEGKPEESVTPAVDKEAKEVKVTVAINYSLIGVSEEQLVSILDNEISKNLVDKKQNVRSNGLDKLVFRVLEKPSEAETVLNIQTIATVGPEIDVEQIKRDVVGKKRGDIEKQIESLSGVRSVSVEYSPVWITTTPKSVDKIEVIISEQDGQ